MIFDVIPWAGVKFGINFMSCSENGNFAVLTTTSAIYPKISLLPVLLQINTIATVHMRLRSDQSVLYSSFFTAYQ